MLAYNLASQNIHTETFDGPLELLMYLINRQGIDIREVQIAPITDAFLAHMETIEGAVYEITRTSIPSITFNKKHIKIIVN